MAVVIKLKSRAADATAPTTGNIENREVAISIPGKTIYINDAGTIKAIANYTTPAGSAKELQYRNGTDFGATSGLVWNDSTNRLSLGAGGSPAATFHLSPASASEIPAITQAFANQTANLHEYRKSDGTVLSNINNVGNYTVGYAIVHMYGLQVSGGLGLVGFSSVANSDRTSFYTAGIRAGGHPGQAQKNFDITFQSLLIDTATAPFTVTGQAAKSSATTNITGGSISLTGGDGASDSAGAAHGGNITLRGGTGYGTGHNGYIILEDLPETSDGIPTGGLWNDNGYVRTGDNAGGIGNTFTFSDSAPDDPINGDTWFHKTTGRKYTYLDDGDSSQWVEMNVSTATLAASTYSGPNLDGGYATSIGISGFTVDGGNA